MSGSIDNSHCSILFEDAKPPPPRPRGWSIPHHGSTSTDPNPKSKTSSAHPRFPGSLISPRQSVAVLLDGENDGGSLRWSTSSEVSCYNGHNRLRDTFEPFGLSAPPRAALLGRCDHHRPPVFQPIKWRRSRDAQPPRASSSERLSVLAPAPAPPPLGKTHSLREFGQLSPTTVRGPEMRSGYIERASIIVAHGSGGESRI